MTDGLHQRIHPPRVPRCVVVGTASGLLGALLLTCPQEAAAYSYRKLVTVACARIATPPHTNFPVLVSVVDPDLRQAPLGRVRSANGYDIAFIRVDSNPLLNGDPLNHELESYDPATGRLVAWVTVPSLGGSCPGTPTTFYMYYGDPEPTCAQSRILGVPATWDPSFRYIFHLGQSGAADPVDSSLAPKTAQRNPTLDPGITNAYAPGIIGSAIDLITSPAAPPPFSPATPTHVRVNDGALTNNQPYTIEGWFFMRTLNPGWVGIATKNRDGGFDDWVGLYKLSNGFAPPNPMGLGNNTGGDVAGTTSLAAGQWYYGAVSWDGVNRRVYRYDVNETTDATAVTLTNVLNPSRLGDDSNGNYLDGLVDEVRFSDFARTPGWIATSARNQGCPSSTSPAPSCSLSFPASLQTPFATFGAEQLTPTNYRSIGAPGIYNTGTVTTTGTAIVTGIGSGWVAANRGRGDLITINGTTYTVRSVDSPTQITVYGTVPPFAGGYSISRAFTSLAAWENCIDGTPVCPAGSPPGPNTTDYIADDRREVGVVFKDAPLVGSVTIAETLTLGRFRDITLTADPGNRHSGRAGAAGAHAILDNNTALPAIRTEATGLVNHITIEWLEIKNGNAGADGIEFNNTTTLFNKLVVRNCVIHNVGGDGIQANGTANDGNGLFYNNVIYQTANDGIGFTFSATPNSSWRMLNNTVYNNARYGISEPVAASNQVFTLVNNISIANTNNDYNVTAGDVTAASTNNITGDVAPPAPGSSPLNGTPLSGAGGVNFINTGVGTEDLHLTTGSPASVAEDAGVFVCNVPRDIDGVVRLNPWEIGADDISQTTAVTLSSFTATGRDGAVDLHWETASELSNLGFHLYRSLAENGPWEPVTTSLIPGLGSSPVGARYAFRDVGLANGTTYFYLLEDVDTGGRAERHGPISATPAPGGPGGSDGGGGSDPNDGQGGSTGGSGRVTFGEPAGVSLREIERGADHVVLELLTPGFVGTTQEDGTVAVTIPGFVETASPGAPAVPVRRALVPSQAGRQVRLREVTPQDVVTFDTLRLSTAAATELVVTEQGMVRAGASPRRQQGSSRGGLSPRLWARALGTLFQGETKKTELELAPLRHDPATGRTVLARRLLVRLEFAGADPRERSQGGARGRRPPSGAPLPAKGVIAQLTVGEPGLVRLRFEDIPGLSRRGVNVRSLRLTHLGQDVPYHVEPDRALFGPGSRLFFRAEDTPSLRERGEAVYELTRGGTAVRMPVISGSPSGSPVGEYLETRSYEESRFYQAALLEAPDLWLWDLLVSPVTRSFPFTLDGLSASTTPGSIRVVLQGASDFPEMDHHVRLSVNGIPVAETTWDGKVQHVVEAEVAPGVLNTGTNTLALENVGDAGAAYSMVFLDRFAVTYPRLGATSGRAEGRFEQGGRAEIAGLSATSFVLDTTAEPAWVKGVEATPGGVAFRVEPGRRYLAWGESSVLTPLVRKGTPSRLRSATNRASWLLIGPRDFLPAARSLLELRRAQGLVARTVALEDVVAEFGFGETSAQAVRSFLTHAFHNWRTPPRYVVLLGDSTYDPRDFLGTGVKDRIPSPVTKTSYLWTVSDPSLAAVNGDDTVPDIALGRLSAGSVAEAERLVAKLVAFEQAGRNFEGTAVLAADNADLAGPFEADQDDIAATVLPDREVEKLYLRDLGGAMRASLRAALDSGPGLLSYVGHGATAVWASENVWNNTDLATLAAQDQQPLLLTLNCLNGFFHFPNFDSLAEAFVKAEGKGAIAAFSPSGLSLDEPAHRYHKALLQEIVSGRHARLGDAVLAAQAAYADSGAFPELLAIYHLFGDPAQQIR